MKKKLLMTVGVLSIGALALASCNNSKDNVYNTSKEFDVLTKEVPSNAKLLSLDEKMDFLNKQSENAKRIGIDDYKNQYSSLVILQKNYTKTKNIENFIYTKTIFDYKNDNYWYYEKHISKEDKKTYTNELETSITKDNDSYIVKNNITLDNYSFIYTLESSGKDEESHTFDTVYKYATGNAKLYIKVDASENTSFISTYLLGRIEPIYRGFQVASITSSDDYKLYTKDNYTYGSYSSSMYNTTYTLIDISKDLFYGRYTLNKDDETSHERNYEAYLSKDSILDKTITTDGYKEYAYDIEKIKNTFDMPFPFFTCTTQAFLGNQLTQSILPDSFFSDNFTVKDELN